MYAPGDSTRFRVSENCNSLISMRSPLKTTVPPFTTNTTLFPLISVLFLQRMHILLLGVCLIRDFYLTQLKFLSINLERNHRQRQAPLQRKTHISVLSRVLVDGLYYTLVTGLKHSLCHSRCAAGKSRSSCDMAKRKISSAGRSWMVTFVLLFNLSKVKT